MSNKLFFGIMGGFVLGAAMFALVFALAKPSEATREHCVDGWTFADWYGSQALCFNPDYVRPVVR